MSAGALVMLGGVAILVLQIGLWLRFGEWLSLSLTNGLITLGAEYPITYWRGVQDIMDGTPLSIAIFAMGLGIELLGVAVETSS